MGRLVVGRDKFLEGGYGLWLDVAKMRFLQKKNLK